MEIKFFQPESIDIPFVIVAMTRQEASDLLVNTEITFDRSDVAPVELEKFQIVKEAILRDGKVDDWLFRYAEKRDDWKPHNYPHNTIHNIIIVDIILLNFLHIHPKFHYSTKFFVANNRDRIDTWNWLSTKGCVMIVDAISLFHPVIYRMLLQAEMSSNKQVAFTILLLPPDSHQANTLIEKEIETRFQRAFARFHWYNERLCKLGVNKWIEFRHWLRDILPELASNIQEIPNPDTIEEMEKRVKDALEKREKHVEVEEEVMLSLISSR